MLGIVVSRADEASVHIGEHLRDLADWTTHEDNSKPDGDGGGTVYRTAGAELRQFDDLHIELVHPDRAFDDVDIVLVASRHSGDTGRLLTAHHTGNFGPAEFGGQRDELAPAAPAALSTALVAFDKHAPDGYGVGLECTHHGPTAVDVPLLFVEVGSEPAQWRDRGAAGAAARIILSLRRVDPHTDRGFVGFGGGHYAPRFTRIVRETDWAVGHIAADWSLAAMGEPNPALVRQTFERSQAQLAVVDGDRPQLAAMVDDLGYRIVGESWLRETTGVPLPTIYRVETGLRPVETGVRFGQPARASAGPPRLDVIEPSADLLADANGVDTEQVRSAIEAHAIGYETEEGGNRVTGRIAIPDAGAWNRIESALVDLLQERFTQVTVEDDVIVAVERSFDPERAQALGVEPGPAFGRLVAGETITIDGTPIGPDDVHVTRERRYPR